MPSLVVNQTISGTELGLLSGIADILVFDSGGETRVYALSRTENVLLAFNVGSDGTLSHSESVDIAGTFVAGSDPSVSVLGMANGSAALLMSGLPQSSGQLVSLDSNGGLGPQVALAGADVLVSPATVDLGTANVLVAGRQVGSGLDLLTDGGDGYWFTSHLPDTSDRYLADIADSVAFDVGAVSYIATVSADEDGVNLAAITSTELVQASRLGVAEGLPINTPTEIDVIQRLDETLLLAGSWGTSSLSVATVGSEGVLQIADHVFDMPETRFQGVTAMDAFTYGDFAFVAVGGGDGGISLFSVLLGGRLVHEASLIDDAATTLYRVSDIEAVVSGASVDLIVSSFWEPGLTRIGYDLSTLGSVLVADTPGGTVTGTDSDDQIVGSDVADILIGAGGDDTIYDGTGEDELTGGLGADLFVFHSDGQLDRVTDFDPDEDRLDLSAFDFLYDVSQIGIQATENGAVLTFGAETIEVDTFDGAPLSEADFSNASVFNIDRPPLLAIPQALQGDASDDTLNGGTGSDTIKGAAGDDRLSGQSGDDWLLGGAGSDSLDGGIGADTIDGEAGRDVLVGGAGNDLLSGGADDDVIYGDEFDWLGV